jgi:hypothetical protein
MQQFEELAKAGLEESAAIMTKLGWSKDMTFER